MEARTTFVANDGQQFKTQAECEEHEAEVLRLGRLQWGHTFLIKTFLRDEFKPIYMTCPGCGGRGVTGGGFKSMDEEQSCSTCYGAKEVIDRDKTPKIVQSPPLPEGLMMVCMNKAWNEFFAKGDDHAAQ